MEGDLGIIPGVHIGRHTANLVIGNCAVSLAQSDVATPVPHLHDGEQGWGVYTDVEAVDGSTQSQFLSRDEFLTYLGTLAVC